MTSAARFRRRRCSDPAAVPRLNEGAEAGARDQRGSVLMLVLGAIALTSTVVVAMLWLNLASLRLTTEHGRIAREQRAADGALEAATGRLSRSTANNPCRDVPDGSSLAVDDEGTAGVPVQVELRCDPLPLPAGGGADGSSDVLGGPSMELVGEQYWGAQPGPAGTSDADTLRHSGRSPLRFDADVRVRSSASVSATDEPAVSASGQYQQGRPGPGGAAGNPCGSLDPAVGPASGSIEDRDRQPSCDDAEAAAMAVRSGSIYSAGDTVSDRTVPAACPAATPVIRFEQGRYDAVQTARLNSLLSGSCANRTFWFEPGRYSFDVNDAARGADRHALVMADPTAKIVFGAPEGWDPAVGAASDDFPRACSLKDPGASVQLSARSTIRHRAGRVAVCPWWNPGTDTPLPAIVQSATAPTQPILVSSTMPTNRVGPINSGCINGWFPPANCNATIFDTVWASAGTADLHSAELLIAAVETPPIHATWSLVNTTLIRPNGSTFCTMQSQPAGRTNEDVVAIDLMAAGNGGTCDEKLAGQKESLFEGMKINVRYWVYNSADCLLGCQVSVRFASVALRLNTTTLSPNAATSARWTDIGRVTVKDGNVSRTSQGSCVLPIPAWGQQRCAHDVEATDRAFTVSDFRPTAAGFSSTDSVETLALRLTSGAGYHNWASIPEDRTWVRVEVERGGASVCAVEREGFFRSAAPALIDLFEAGGSCRAAVSTMADLATSTVRVTYRTDCMLDANNFRIPPGWDGKCPQVRTPELDHVALEVTSDSVPRPPTMHIRIDATTGGGGESSFNVFGDTVLPKSDLDLTWGGGATDLPVFGATTTFNGLASVQADGATVGVVCCSPLPVTTLRLQASIGGRVVAESSLSVGPPGSGGVPPDVPRPRRSISVLEWRICRGGTCSSDGAPPQVLSASEKAPPDDGPP